MSEIGLGQSLLYQFISVVYYLENNSYAQYNGENLFLHIEFGCLSLIRNETSIKHL